MKTPAFIASLVVKAALIALACVGLWLTIFGGNGFMSADSLLYFTVQSNLWILIVTIAFFVMLIVERSRGKACVRRWMLVVKFVCATSVTLTFLVFAALLAPTMRDTGYLSSLGNLCVHFFVPIIAIVDFLLFDRAWRRGRFTFALAAIPPLAYFLLTVCLSLGGVRYHDGDVAPYYFLNYEKLGWLRISSDGIGVVYWVLILAALICVVGIGLLALKGLISRRLARGESSGEA